jgi:hypothetical protein
MGKCDQPFPPPPARDGEADVGLVAWPPDNAQGLGLEPVRIPCAVCMARHGCRALSPTWQHVGSRQRHGKSRALGRGPQALDHQTNHLIVEER